MNPREVSGGTKLSLVWGQVAFARWGRAQVLAQVGNRVIGRRGSRKRERQAGGRRDRTGRSAREGRVGGGEERNKAPGGLRGGGAGSDGRILGPLAALGQPEPRGLHVRASHEPSPMPFDGLDAPPLSSEMAVPSAVPVPSRWSPSGADGTSAVGPLVPGSQEPLPSRARTPEALPCSASPEETSGRGP